jgi:hypothetical protein
MRKQIKCYENYPYWIILVSNTMQLALYAAGAIIVSFVGLFWMSLYIIYILWLEVRLLRKSCVNCYYYGKRCSFGKGKICALIFKRGDNKKFAANKITWKDILPDFLVGIVPIIIGIVMLLVDFRWIVLLLIIMIFLFSFIGNWLVRSQLACKFCKQRGIGCPAEKLFNKKK